MTAATLPVGVSRLLGAGGRGAWAVYAVFAACNVTFAVATLDMVQRWWVSIAALALVLAAASLLARAAPDPFPARWTAAVLASGLVATGMVAGNVIENDGPGREEWYAIAFTWMLFLLAMRGRPVAAWAGLVGMVAVKAASAAAAGHDALAAAIGFQTSVAIVLVATLSTQALRRTSAEINATRDRIVRLAESAAKVHATTSVRRRRLDELRATAAPLLRRILNSVETTDNDRVDYRLGEAAIRDLVRGRALVTPDVAKAARAARARGVEVTLLDDRGAPLGSAVGQRIVAVRLVELLEGARAGAVTARLAPAGRPVAVSIVAERDGNSERVELDEDGQDLASAGVPGEAR